MSRFSVMGLVVVAVLAGQPSQAQDADARRITVVGAGSSTAVPDIAVIRLGVEARDDSAAVAIQTMNAALTEVIDSLGGSSEDIQTSSLMLQQDRDRSGSLSYDALGYVAQSVVTVRTQDMAGLGDLIDAAVGAGANRIEGISFAVADPEGALNEARMAAIAQAQSKAQLFAQTAGVVLGDLITMSESGGGQGPSMRTMAIEPGAVSLSTTITMVYAING